MIDRERTPPTEPQSPQCAFCLKTACDAFQRGPVHLKDWGTTQGDPLEGERNSLPTVHLEFLPGTSLLTGLRLLRGSRFVSLAGGGIWLLSSPRRYAAPRFPPIRSTLLWLLPQPHSAPHRRAPDLHDAPV